MHASYLFRSYPVKIRLVFSAVRLPRALQFLRLDSKYLA